MSDNNQSQIGAPTTQFRSSNTTASTYVAPDSHGEHPLEHIWDLFHIDPKEMDRQTHINTWDPIFIASFSTVRDFWRVFNNIAPPSYLPTSTFLYMFKHGVPPKWEAPENCRGGELTLSLALDSHDPDSLDTFDSVWMDTLLALIGEYFTDSNQTNGVSCSIKSKWIKIALWVGDAKDSAALDRIKKQWIELIPGWKIEEITFRSFTK